VLLCGIAWKWDIQIVTATEEVLICSTANVTALVRRWTQGCCRAVIVVLSRDYMSIAALSAHILETYGNHRVGLLMAWSR